METCTGFGAVVIVVVCAKFACSAPVSSQSCAKGNLLILDISKATFNSTAWSKIETKVAELLNDHCEVNFNECSLSSWNATRDSFAADDIKLNNGYPKETGKDVEISLYASLPSNSSARVPSATFTKVLDTNLSDISRDIGYTVKFKSCSIPEEKSDEIDHTLNYVMIPVAFFLLLLVAGIAFILHRHHKQTVKEREKRIRQENHRRLKEKEARSTKTKEVQAVKEHHKEKTKNVAEKESLQPEKEKPLKSERKGNFNRESEHDKQNTQKVVADVNRIEGEREPMNRRHKKRRSKKHQGETNKGYDDDGEITPADGEGKGRGAENIAEPLAVDEEKPHKKKRRSKRRHHRNYGESDEGYHEESNGQKLSPRLPPVVTHSAPRTLSPLTPTSPIYLDTKM